MREIKLFPNIRVFMCVSSLNSYHFDFNHWRTAFQSKSLFVPENMINLRAVSVALACKSGSFGSSQNVRIM